MKLTLKLNIYFVLLIISLLGCNEKRTDQPASEAQKEVQESTPKDTETNSDADYNDKINKADENQNSMNTDPISTETEEKVIKSYDEVKGKMDDATDVDQLVNDAQKSAQDAQERAEEQTKIMLEKAEKAAQKAMDNANKKVDSASKVLETEKKSIEDKAKKGKDKLQEKLNQQ